MSFAGNYLELYDQVCFEVFWSYKTGTSKKINYSSKSFKEFSTPEELFGRFLSSFT
jgi:hypothetical protein